MSNDSFIEIHGVAFRPVSLAALESAALLRRQELKYLVSESRLGEILQRMAGAYQILNTSGRVEFSYETDYYDSPEFRCYHQHLQDMPNRQKLRIRRYVDAGQTMIELKQKGGDGRICKLREAVHGNAGLAAILATGTIASRLPHDLSSWTFSLQTRYRRLSFLAIDRSHRLTVDTGVAMSDSAGRSVSFPGLAIVELKLSGKPGYASLITAGIRAAGGLRTPFSKYMAGMSLLYPELSSGILKPRSLALQRLRIAPHFL